ncbi:HAMP domain-containing sensor histidine kinase [Arthrobacter sp. Br18]|uniref:sensor histidine kinase n=1 Tax=Arthrobacter sp. Br18 TaxID=1312954 RepID=UPI0012DD37AC|nr:HAMP domain-containing sensor histidine kinase [Arthrobacter sp. Br18]
MTPAKEASPRWASSMRVRIIAVVVVLLLLSSIGSVLLLRVVLFERLDEEIGVSLDREAEEFQLLAGGVDPRTGEPFGDNIAAIFDVYFSREIADEGETLLAFIDGNLYESRRAARVPDTEEFEQTIGYWLSLNSPTSGSIDSAAGNTQYFAVPIQGEPDDGMFVVANFPANERGEITDAVQTQVLVQLGTTALASLLGLALAGRVLRPLRNLAQTARTISETDLSRRIEVEGKDEASQIAGAFNDMLARLEQSFTTQRQFLDDTSHELRTPLTIIRGHLELLELDETPEERAQTVAVVTDEVDRMNRIVADLFLLARAERPDFLRLEPVELQDLICAVHRKMCALAPRDWQVTPPPPAVIPADRNRLTQALLQLADNAVKFTEPGAAVQLGATTTGNEVRLWVANSGPPVPSEDAGKIFARFRRGSTRPAPNPGGAGLGLSIVAAIAEAHGGRAELVPRPGWGVSFEIVIPKEARETSHQAVPRPTPADAST